MKLLYFHQYFKTPHEAGSTRSYYVAKSLVERGHEVHLVTTHATRSGVQEIDGIFVHYLKIKYDNKFNKYRRILAFLLFIVKGIIEAAKIGKVDFAYITSTPLSVGLIALYLKSLKGIPYIFEVRDLWPDFPIQIGAIKNKFLIKILRRFEKSIYSQANKIIALSPGMEAGVKRVNPSFDVKIFPNFSDVQLFSPVLKRTFYKNKLIGPKNYGVVYFGTIGRANDLDFFIHMARKTNRINKNFRFYIVGDGSERIRLMNTLSANDKKYIFFVDPIPKTILPLFISQMDFGVVCFADLPILTTNSPNKFFDSLASGLVTVVNTDGWLKTLVEEHNCGFHVPAGKPELFAKLAVDLIKSPSKLEKCKTNARKLTMERFYNLQICNDLVDEIEISFYGKVVTENAVFELPSPNFSPDLVSQSLSNRGVNQIK